MKEILVWLLVAVSDGGYNQGNSQAIERFATQKDCEIVAKELKAMNRNALSKCIQVTIIR